MSDNGIDYSIDLTIDNELGLHARTAAMIARIAQKAVAPVWIVKGDQKAEATSIIDMLSLGCAKGSQVTVQIENDQDREVLQNIVELVEKGFGE
jgi:phosphotransferase system HPr (HPr) family protein